MRDSAACALCLFLVFAFAIVAPATSAQESPAEAGSIYNQVTRFVGAQVAAGSVYGTAVAIDGDTLVVGDSGNNAAYVFTFDDDGKVTQQARLQPADVVVTDGFGTAVAISGETLVVGSLLTNAAVGGAYVYNRSGTTWNLVAKLVPTGGANSDNFGFAVDIAANGDLVVVGAPGVDTGGFGEQGAVYAYTRTSRSTAKATWTYSEQMFQGSDTDEQDQFGSSVATDGVRIVGGSYSNNLNHGAAYVFNVATMTQEAKLTGSDSAAGDELARSVDISGSFVVAGAPFATWGGNMEGAAYVFTNSAREGAKATWTQDAKLVASDRDVLDQFGVSVAIDGSLVIVGADDDDEEGTDSGSVYIYQRDSGFARGSSAKADPWLEIDKITGGSDGGDFEGFGMAVAIQGPYALVGALNDLPNGASYLFINDSAVGCDLLLNPTSISAGGFSTTKTIGVATSGACQWQATSSATWANFVVGGASSGSTSGTGPTNVQVKIDQNPGSGRSATLTFTSDDGFSQTIAVTQGGATSTDPFVNVTPASVTVPADGSISSTHVVVASGPTATQSTGSFAAVDYSDGVLTLRAPANTSTSPVQRTMNVCLSADSSFCTAVVVAQPGAAPPTTSHYAVPPRSGARGGVSAAIAVVGNDSAGRGRGLIAQGYDGAGERNWTMSLDEVTGTAEVTAGDLDGDGDDEIVFVGINSDGTPVAYVRSTSGKPAGSVSAGTTAAVSATPMVLRRPGGVLLAFGIVQDSGAAVVEFWRYGRAASADLADARGRLQFVEVWPAGPSGADGYHFEAADFDGDGQDEVFAGRGSANGKGAWFEIITPGTGSAGAVEAADKKLIDATWLIGDLRADTPGMEVFAGLYDKGPGRAMGALFRGDGERLSSGAMSGKRVSGLHWDIVSPAPSSRAAAAMVVVGLTGKGGQPEYELHGLEGDRPKSAAGGRLDGGQTLDAVKTGNFDGDASNGDELALLLTQSDRSVDIVFLDQDGNILGRGTTFGGTYFDPALDAMEVLSRGTDEAVLLGRTVDDRPILVVVSVDGTVQTSVEVLSRGVQ